MIRLEKIHITVRIVRASILEYFLIKIIELGNSGLACFYRVFYTMKH